MRDPRRIHPDNAAERIFRELRVSPICNRRLEKGLIGIGSGGFVFGSANDNAGISFFYDMDEHVWILLLRPLRAVALRIGIGGYMERIELDGAVDVLFDVLGKTRVDLVKDILAVPQRPHLPNRLIADPGDDAAQVPHDRVDRLALVLPVLGRVGELEPDRRSLAVLLISHNVAGLGIMRHVVDAGANIDDGLERGVSGDIANPLAIDVNDAPIAERIPVFLTGPDHVLSSLDCGQNATCTN